MASRAGLPSGSHSAPVLPGGMPGYVPSGLSGQHAALGLPGHLQASAAMLAVPGAIPGAMAGAVPGQVPGTMSGAALGVPGATPGVPGVISGMPGAVPGTIPGAIPGAMPGMPGSVPGMGVSMPYAAGALGMHGLPAAGMHASVPTATPSFPGFAALSNPMLMTGPHSCLSPTEITSAAPCIARGTCVRACHSQTLVCNQYPFSMMK